MTYKNVKTGFVFTTDSVISAPDWVKLDPEPTISEEKPKSKTKKVTKKNELCD